MNSDIISKNQIQRLMRLRKEKVIILGLTPEKALDRILDAEQPVALVHSFSEEDLYFLIQSIGPEDALELLSLASNRQWEFILDIETWKKDRIAIPALTRWLQLLFKADPDRFIRWIYEEKTYFFEYYLYQNIELRIREHDQDPSDFDDDFFTLDDILYIRFIKPVADEFPKEDVDKLRESFLSKLIHNLAGYDLKKYTNLLVESQSLISAEAEEEAYRWRNVRMVEKGFLPFEEAIGIYQPMTTEDIEAKPMKYMPSNPEDQLLPVPVYHREMLNEDSLFAQSLQVIAPDDIFSNVHAELANLCNQIISADQKQIDDKEDLRHIVKKAAGYLSIGLEKLLNALEKSDIKRTAALIKRHALIDIFRVGFGTALKLKWQAERWRRKSWFEQAGLPIVFWGESWLGVLGGLLIQKPLFFDNYRSGVLYREFETWHDIRQTEKALNEIIAFDNLLLLMNIQVQSFSSDPFLTYKNVVLTDWAQNDPALNIDAADKDNALRALTFDEFKTMFLRLWEVKGKSRRIKESIKTRFLNYLADKSGLDDYEIIDRLGKTLESLFNEVESEYRGVKTEYLDPKYIPHFLIQK